MALCNLRGAKNGNEDTLSSQKERWRIALHEASHVVAFRLLNGWDPSIHAELPAGGGGYTSNPPGMTKVNFAIAVAAGSHGEKMAKTCSRPWFTPTSSPTPAPETGATANEIRQHAVRTMKWLSDDEHIAQAAISFAPANPADWKERFDYFHSEAEQLVADHADEIKRVAAELYSNGSYDHAGDPAHDHYFGTMP